MLSHYDLTKHLPETISIFEIVGCLAIYLGSKSMPIDTLIERDTLHPSWTNNFDDAFFLALEQLLVILELGDGIFILNNF